MPRRRSETPSGSPTGGVQEGKTLPQEPLARSSGRATALAQSDDSGGGGGGIQSIYQNNKTKIHITGAAIGGLLVGYFIK